MQRSRGSQGCRVRGGSRVFWKPPRFLEPLTGKTATTSFSMRISWEGRKGAVSEQRRGSVPGAARRVTSSRDPRRPPYLEVRAVVTIGIDDLPLSPVAGQHRHHFSSCQVSVELGGEDADAGSGQSLGEGRLKPPCLTPSLSPPRIPLLPAPEWPSLRWLLRGGLGIAVPLGQRRCELPGEGQMLSLLPNPIYVLPCPASAGAAEPDAACFPAFVSGGTNDSFWVGPIKNAH